MRAWKVLKVFRASEFIGTRSNAESEAIPPEGAFWDQEAHSSLNVPGVHVYAFRITFWITARNEVAALVVSILTINEIPPYLSLPFSDQISSGEIQINEKVIQDFIRKNSSARID
jgi:hypothetical protein